MKGLLKYISPFAPDQSGAASVFYDLGGITIICDAGGCTGNICGFDEPRWFLRKSAIFSAGLRDMDAILGRDDRLVEKLKDTADKLDAKFAAIIGTPVPAVIATDFMALRRMAEKRVGLPVITIECTGTRLYDEGEEEAYLKLVQKFADHSQQEKIEKSLGVFGVTPLDLSDLFADQKLKKVLRGKGYEEIYTYGMGDGIEKLALAGRTEKNLVVSPAGLAAARYLKKEFGTPYEVGYPLALDAYLKGTDFSGKRVLIVHQQVLANELREQVKALGAKEAMVASWFFLKPEIACEGDERIKTEHRFTHLLEEGDFDIVIGDQLIKRAAKGFQGQWIHLPHFAVSGEYQGA